MKTIPLTQGRVAIVDDEDFDRVSEFKWTFMAKRYAGRLYNKNGKRAAQYLHRFIMGNPVGMDIDHKGDSLDNRKENLRTCTTTQNSYNRGPSKNNRSGIKGVYWVKRERKWNAWIRIDGRNKCLGWFDSKEAAALAYGRAAIELHGEFVNLQPEHGHYNPSKLTPDISKLIP